MKHQELLGKIDELELYDWAYMPSLNALRAVIELHKPVMAFTGGYDGEENELWEEQCQECSGNGFSQMHPCPTTQAIEKELV